MLLLFFIHFIYNNNSQQVYQVCFQEIHFTNIDFITQNLKHVESIRI